MNDVDVNAERAIAQRFKRELSDDEIVTSELGMDSGATTKRRKLASQERALFSQQGVTQTGGSSGRSY